ncbi:MAG: tRNA preQ1(34) S-adenosylmethionine ribosyltransferase-isomerase QueA [bacterium]|nr:tRNA preQ1(34) S-adenosylmethionine ribosyltransferase-isomerase QueA [bacterium]
MTKKNHTDIETYKYSLPGSLIAQVPAARRTGSRLLHLDRGSGTVGHLGFTDLVGLLRPGDLLILNDTKVFPARITCRRVSGGSVELMLKHYPDAGGQASCLVRPGRRMRDSEEVFLGDAGADTLVVHRKGELFTVSGGVVSVAEAISRYGRIPLPPYIRRDSSGPGAEDEVRYQTVYADRLGAVAAPTAGLHFDTATIQAIASSGVGIASVTLHVGPGTFQPVRVRDISMHTMEMELYHIPEETAAAVMAAKRSGGRVIAVGTTVVRTLESGSGGRHLKAGDGNTGLFITPGYRFKVVDALLTNFHLPRSTLLMLVCAFGGTERVIAAYGEAVREKYRFYSYGDCMFVE